MVLKVTRMGVLRTYGCPLLSKSRIRALSAGLAPTLNTRGALGGLAKRPAVLDAPRALGSMASIHHPSLSAELRASPHRTGQRVYPLSLPNLFLETSSHLKHRHDRGYHYPRLLF